MNSSHLGVIHVGKRIRTFSKWGVQTMEFKTEVGIDTRAKNGGYGCSHLKVGAHLWLKATRFCTPASDCFWHLPIPGYFVYVCMVQQSTTCKFTHYQHSAYKQSVDTLFLTPSELLFIIGQLHIAQQSCTVKFCSSTSLSASNLQQQQCTMRLQVDIEIFLQLFSNNFNICLPTASQNFLLTQIQNLLSKLKLWVGGADLSPPPKKLRKNVLCVYYVFQVILSLF